MRGRQQDVERLLAFLARRVWHDASLPEPGDKLPVVVSLVRSDGLRIESTFLQFLDLLDCDCGLRRSDRGLHGEGTHKPLRFSMVAWPAMQSRASLPGPLRMSFASGSVVEACVSLRHCSPLKSVQPLPLAGPLGSSFGRKLFNEAQDSIRVPSTLK